MNETEKHILALSPEDPIRIYVIEQVRRADDAFQRCLGLEETTESLNSEVLRLESELEEARDYLRLVREERDTLKIQLNFCKDKKHLE